jgi:hypothetical protein
VQQIYDTKLLASSYFIKVAAICHATESEALFTLNYNLSTLNFCIKRGSGVDTHSRRLSEPQRLVRRFHLCSGEKQVDSD